MTINKVPFLEPWEIEEKVDEVLHEAKSQGFYDFNSNTPLDLIAEKICGLRLDYRNLDGNTKGVIGMIDCFSNIICIDESLNYDDKSPLSDEGRHNFTLSHEIGHYFLHKNLLTSDNSMAFHNEFSEETKKAEIQANMFGAMLLMPRELMFKKLNKDFNCIKNLNEKITKMTQFFRASREAMQNRLVNLGLVGKL